MKKKIINEKGREKKREKGEKNTGKIKYPKKRTIQLLIDWPRST